jgi:hypothetical protein
MFGRWLARKRHRLRFARIVFAVAGFSGLCVTMPLYFLYDFINGLGPAPITLREFYFGFAGVTLAWQIAFLIIAADPARHRMMMIPSIIEKLSYVFANVALLLSGDITVSYAAVAIPDLGFAIFFMAALLKSRPIKAARA